MSASHHDPVLIKLQLIEKFRLILVKSKQNEGEATKEAIQFLQELQKNQPLSSADQFEILMSLAKSTAKKGSDKGGVFIFLKADEFAQHYLTFIESLLKKDPDRENWANRIYELLGIVDHYNQTSGFKISLYGSDDLLKRYLEILNNLLDRHISAKQILQLLQVPNIYNVNLFLATPFLKKHEPIERTQLLLTFFLIVYHHSSNSEISAEDLINLCLDKIKMKNTNVDGYNFFQVLNFFGYHTTLMRTLNFFSSLFLQDKQKNAENVLDRLASAHLDFIKQLMLHDNNVPLDIYFNFIIQLLHKLSDENMRKKFARKFVDYDIFATYSVEECREICNPRFQQGEKQLLVFFKFLLELRKLLENNLSMGDNISSAIIHEKNYRLVLSLLQNNLLDKKFFPRIDTKEFFKFISELPDLSKRGHYLCSALDSQHPIGQVFQNAAEISIIRMMCPPILTPIYIDRNNAVLFKNHWLVKEEVEMVQQENRKTL